MSYLILKIRVLFMPSCWIQPYPYSETYDQWLKKVLKTHKFKVENQYEATIDGETVWIENHPYASFTKPHGFVNRVRPARSTILLAWDKLQKEQ